MQLENSQVLLLVSTLVLAQCTYVQGAMYRDVHYSIISCNKTMKLNTFCREMCVNFICVGWNEKSSVDLGIEQKVGRFSWVTVSSWLNSLVNGSSTY